jgi:hypothetical protein
MTIEKLIRGENIIYAQPFPNGTIENENVAKAEKLVFLTAGVGCCFAHMPTGINNHKEPRKSRAHVSSAY